MPGITLIPGGNYTGPPTLSWSPTGSGGGGSSGGSGISIVPTNAISSPSTSYDSGGGSVGLPYYGGYNYGAPETTDAMLDEQAQSIIYTRDRPYWWERSVQRQQAPDTLWTIVTVFAVLLATKAIIK